MKKAIFAGIAALIASSAHAASDFSMSFTIIGGLQLTNGSYVSLDLDGNLGNRYVSVFGAMQANDGLSSPATGSCFITGTGGAFCNLQVDHLSITVDLDSTLNGLILVKDASGVTLDVSQIQIIR